MATPLRVSAVRYATHGLNHVIVSEEQLPAIPIHDEGRKPLRFSRNRAYSCLRFGAQNLVRGRDSGSVGACECSGLPTQVVEASFACHRLRVTRQ